MVHSTAQIDRRLDCLTMAHKLARATIRDFEIPPYRAYLFPLVVAGLALLFLSAPWPLHHKAHAALHGLCAQRPSHSFVLGGERLPFDARMTGIYGGFAVAAAFLLLRRRYRSAAMPSPWTLTILASFVGAMAIDGFNSLLVDLRVWHAYQPSNLLRLATGSLTGIALAVVICYLLAVTLWRRPDLTSSPVQGLREVGLLVLVQLPFSIAVAGETSVLFVPVTLFLVLSAAAVLTALMLVVVVLLRRADGTFSTAAQMQGSATVAFGLALVVMAALGGGRYLLEYFTAGPPLT